jgi:multidrug efflux pump subunit AcrA (membrane-fusion protein)
VKPGMTADVKIITSEKENVLTVPQEAIQKKNGNKIVQVYSECNSIYQPTNCYKNKKAEDREVVTGLEGSDGLIEIVSGLQEGEKVILK